MSSSLKDTGIFTESDSLELSLLWLQIYPFTGVGRRRLYLELLGTCLPPPRELNLTFPLGGTLIAHMGRTDQKSSLYV